MDIRSAVAALPWRRVLGEVGIIVVGVLIALSAEEFVESLHWRRQVALTEEALTGELVISAAQALERVAVEQCLRNRITRLTGKLATAEGRWTADPMPVRAPGQTIVRSVPAAYRAPTRLWISDSWETAMASGVLSHMRRDRVAAFSAMYAMIAELRRLQEQEATLAPTLSFLSFDTPLHPQSRAAALGTLAQLDFINAQISVIAQQMLPGLRALELRYDRNAASAELRDEIAGHQQRLGGSCVRNVKFEF